MILHISHADLVEAIAEGIADMTTSDKTPMPDWCPRSMPDPERRRHHAIAIAKIIADRIEHEHDAEGGC